MRAEELLASERAQICFIFKSYSTRIDSILKREIENIFVKEKSRFTIGILDIGF